MNRKFKLETTTNTLNIKNFMRVTVALLAATGFVACASTGSGGAADRSAAAEAPVKTPFQAPEWESTEFVDADYGFRLHYPSDFTTEEAQAPAGRLTAASPMMAPRVDVNVTPYSGDSSLEEAAAATEAQMAQLGGGEAKVIAQEVITLKDDVTKGFEYVVEWTFQGFPLQSIVLLVPSTSGEELINVTATGMAGNELAELRNIAYTLYLD